MEIVEYLATELGLPTHGDDSYNNVCPPLFLAVYKGDMRLTKWSHAAISASPTPCPLRGYGRAGTRNDRLGGV